MQEEIPYNINYNNTCWIVIIIIIDSDKREGLGSYLGFLKNLILYVFIVNGVVSHIEMNVHIKPLRRLINKVFLYINDSVIFRHIHKTT